MRVPTEYPGRIDALTRGFPFAQLGRFAHPPLAFVVPVHAAAAFFLVALRLLFFDATGAPLFRVWPSTYHGNGAAQRAR